MGNHLRRRPHTLLPDSKYQTSDAELLPLEKKHTKLASIETFEAETIFKTKPGFRLEKFDYVSLLILTFLSLFTHLYKIGKRNQVTWDESHFGKFGAYYINRTFYHDVHPPLAKMLVGLAEVIAGHNGSFDFKGGYPKYVNYTSMRIQLALYGAALVPIAYITCRAIGLSKRFSLLGAMFILFDNALTLMCRFILLDEPLLFFTALSLMFAVLFFTAKNFSKEWFAYIFLTGLSLGAVLSSKWVGLFCFAFVGLVTAEDLFNKFADLSMSNELQIKHWSIRVAALILTPALIYMATFKVHFMILNKSGPGDKDMPVEFQAHLKGSPLSPQPYLLAYGAQVAIRSSNIGSGYLHSHSSNYPTGSLLQQITCYGYDDSNGKWIVEHPDKGRPYDYFTDEKGNPREPEYVEDEVYVRLRHEATNKYLYMDNTLSISSPKEYEASCKVLDSITNDSFLWQIKIEKDLGETKSNKLRTISSKFSLRNKKTGSYLISTGNKLPGWGFDQNEVVGARFKKGDHTIWLVEKNKHKLVPGAAIPVKKPGFLSSFLTLNKQMAKSNNALVPDRDKYNHLESDPITWPFLIYPMRLNGAWNPSEIKYYQIGNPLTWWSSTLSVLIFPVALVFVMIISQRSGSSKDIHYSSLFWNRGKFFYLGWVLHYMPFFLMGRVTYIHHYLPAAYFSYLNLAFMLDFFVSTGFIKVSNLFKTLVFLIMSFMSVFGFYLFMPLTFGYSENIYNLRFRQWLSTWNIYESGHVM
ncbi:hypothetical protein BB560_004084 [Smittium megazygosporum]|uniref:Dolichyl-phosphate-mannose--protein mannosyltransferase n=1 Tax=Smittium megazygosporum TaxID=133381 RepID=A0A2T9ZAB2_9FUNG|nr:hypothetical protein BB560_004084 [Smittium megazygosporum]